MGRRFPIPREHLPKLRVSQQEHQAGKQLMAALLAHTVREFEAFAYDRKGVVDSKRWKLQYSRDDMNMYRERDAGVTSYELAKTLRHCDLQSPTFACTEAALTPPTVMLTGWGPGRVENAMSAVVTECQQDLALVVTYMHQDVADCAIVHTMEHPSDDAPYHYLGYKYFSRTGETLGFHLMQSVELSQFPDLSGHNSIRALQSSRYLYRQKSDRVVEVFTLGNMDLSGMIVKPIASIFSACAQFGVTRLLDLAEVRRLTDMARNRRRYRDGVCPRCRSTKRVWGSDSFGILGSFRKIQACSKCVMHANTGTYEAPADRARSQRWYQSSVSTDRSDSDASSKSPQTPEMPVTGRSFVHQGARIYPDAAQIAVPCTSPEFELTDMAEATSYTTQVNGMYFAQQRQQQFKMQSRADWRK
ncbi:hypothetical protein PHYSODRAFT_506323 [Phytophthora sojae]|uniref:START domain-containing protein n=1 Tax=Phytophthora sojae (strain P6497) TaxID=1094619 RepID=G4ZMZ7_PHYSP|nr:hypothetical protein PHYSODRAFT_506323 [Phytophthora sojae]EGZ15026.1 hypothetical protein PHYSODRAFT_506323 [Phytophthora sojae]|eukprot:XP_009528775.1 hypothetical protein PHYSODRAFT_506323 [Phytophthora sojae]